MRLQSVSKRYGLRQPWVVKDVTAELPPGKLIRLEGRNGAGKSTLLKIASGVCLPSAGRVIGRQRTGYVPERFPGGFAFPARDYLTHMARVHGVRGSAVAASVDEWLDRLGATEFAASPMRSLSKGMCQKVAIAQALLAKPSLLALDEAWTGLDQAARGALDAAVAERVASGGTVVFVDHDPARLAGQVDERWQLDGSGSVAVSSAHAAAPAPALPAPASPAPALPAPALPAPALAALAADPPAAAVTSAADPLDTAVTTVTVSGLDEGSLARLRSVPGVLSCTSDTVRASAGCSDAVLRVLLSLGGVHVIAVRTSGES